ncbi:MAG: ATP-binding protein [Bryobacteraceae bacterium]
MLARIIRSKILSIVALGTAIFLLVLVLSLMGTEQKFNLLVVLCALLGLAPVVMFQLYRRDMSVRDDAETELRESERRYRQLIEYSPNAICVHEGGRIRYANTAWVKMLGAESDKEILGKQVLEFFAPASQTEVKDLISRLYRGEGTPHEQHLIRRDGSSMDVEICAVSCLRERGETVQIVIRDITEQKRAREATAKALELSRQATQMKSEFLAHMSHELRTPMNGVMGMAEVLLTTPISAEQREYAEVIRSSAGQLMSLLNDVLDLARLEAGQLQLEKDPFDLRAVVSNVASLYSTQAQSKHLRFSVTIATDVPARLWGDEARLRQILTNLVDNAIKFTEQGGISLRLTCLGSVNGVSKLYCAVEDTGIGIPREKQERIFDNFEQADGTITRAHGGMGLGLSICQRFIHLMGGEIGVHSASNGGTRFWFTVDLPVADDPVPAICRPAEALVH